MHRLGTPLSTGQPAAGRFAVGGSAGPPGRRLASGGDAGGRELLVVPGRCGCAATGRSCSQRPPVPVHGPTAAPSPSTWRRDHGGHPLPLTRPARGLGTHVGSFRLAYDVVTVRAYTAGRPSWPSCWPPIPSRCWLPPAISWRPRDDRICGVGPGRHPPAPAAARRRRPRPAIRARRLVAGRGARRRPRLLLPRQRRRDAAARPPVAGPQACTAEPALRHAAFDGTYQRGPSGNCPHLL